MKKEYDINEICNEIYKCKNKEQFDKVMEKMRKDILIEDEKKTNDLHIKTPSEYIINKRENQYFNNHFYNNQFFHMKAISNYNEHFNREYNSIRNNSYNYNKIKFYKHYNDYHANSKCHYPDEYNLNENINMHNINYTWSNTFNPNNHLFINNSTRTYYPISIPTYNNNKQFLPFPSITHSSSFPISTPSSLYFTSNFNPSSFHILNNI